MEVNKNNSKVYLSAEEIRCRVIEIAKKISEDFKGKDLLVVGVLKGAWIFLADLVREMSCDCEVDFISVSSYGTGMESRGNIIVRSDITANCNGRDVLLVEDIVDTGITIEGLTKIFRQKNAKSISVATLLSKPSRRKIDVKVDYICFEVPDEFVFGYGLDLAEYSRGVKEVCLWNASECQK